MDRTNSERIVNAYREMKPKFERKNQVYSVTLETSMDMFFPLLCPVREADWIPGWTTEILYSKSGLAENRVVFVTDETNSHGPGIWTFTGFERDKFLEFVLVQEDMIADGHIDVRDNNDGTVSGTWNITATALTEKGNQMVNNMPSLEERREFLQKLLADYLKNPAVDTSKSDLILQRFRNRKTKLQRKEMQFSGTLKTDMETFFPLLCPAREADWIPGWDCRLIYTNSGYAEDKCVFVTDSSNPNGDGVWIFTDFKKNDYIEFLRVSDDIMVHCRITAEDNHDGTITATWRPVITALTERGNGFLSSHESATEQENGLIKMLESYLGGKQPKGAHHFHNMFHRSPNQR